MKAGMFKLTKSEQRVIILVMLALLGAAFVRYWRDVNTGHQPNVNQQDPVPTTSLSPQEDAQLNLEESAVNGATEHSPPPSPQSSP
jgi:hypothetical protein